MRVRQHRSVGVVGLAVWGVLALQSSRAHSGGTVTAGKSADTRNAPASSDVRRHVEDVARRIFAITDVVLEHHIEPATRQEMILGGLKAAIAAKKLTVPDLSRRVSDLKTPEELTGLLNELWPKLARGGKPSSDQVETALFDGLLRPVQGTPHIMPAKEARVQAQIQANRYIGIGIALTMADKLPQIKHVQPGGPAQLGGVRAGDLIEQINQNRVLPGVRLVDVVDQLRGPEGTELTIRVRQPEAKESRTLALVRLPVMFKSVKSSQENAEDERVAIVNAKPAIAYLKIDSIMASTARELASWEPRLREAGIQGLILDLRGSGERETFHGYHSALLLADSLLDGKHLGKLRTREGVREFNADRECLFRDLPLAVLVDKSTNGPAAWVAAALQDSDPPQQKRRRAIIVGTLGGSDNFVREGYPLPGGEELILANGVWERPGADKDRQRIVRFYRVEGAGANPSSASTVEELQATTHREGVMPDAYVFFTDPLAGFKDVEVGEIGLAAQPSPARAYVAPPSRKSSGAREVKGGAPRQFDAFEQAAVHELQQQIELAGKKP